MSPLTKGHNASTAEAVPEHDRLATDVMADWKAPGAALAVVQDGKVALAKACGQGDVEANLPVTPTTQFLICSITKSFSALWSTCRIKRDLLAPQIALGQIKDALLRKAHSCRQPKPGGCRQS
jgi:CubicO group peptidase (beta-lactamase class C family)